MGGHCIYLHLNKTFSQKTPAPGEARTHGLQIMRLTRCLLRYGGTLSSRGEKSQRAWKNIPTHGGTRTPNLRFRRPTPYPLGHAGRPGRVWQNLPSITKNVRASPGNRTRVARMGILHDTTTPAMPLRVYWRLCPYNLQQYFPAKSSAKHT